MVMNHQKRNMLLLSVAYAANIGGTGILTGSPTNLVVLTQLKGSNVSYITWMMFAVPLMATNLLIAFLWLFLAEKLSACCSIGLFNPQYEKLKLYNEKSPESLQMESKVSDLNRSKDSIRTQETTTEIPMPGQDYK